MAAALSALERPRLARRARLQLDELTGSYVLLSPERGLVLNAAAAAILKRCHGDETVEQIVRELASGADYERALSDTLELLSGLKERHLLEPIREPR